MMAFRRRRSGQQGGVRRAVVMLPNGFTLFNLFCGIYAIILALHQDLAAAPGFVVLGGIADALDGRVARATGTGSRFGEELDSLVDCISFGLAPALIVYLGRPVGTQGNLDWLLVFIYTACAVMRLARFNVEQAGRKKTHFHGLPSPAAGLTLATYYWFAQTPLYNETVILFTNSTTLAQLPWHNLLRGLMAILAALMISDVPYPAMPAIGFNSIKRVLSTLMVITALLLVVFRRQEFIFPALLAYVIYGVVNWVIIGFLGRSSTPDEIFWEREAELHQEDELRSAYDRPHIGKEALEDAEEADREDRGVRESRREAREGREGREGRQRSRTREERKSKRREEGKRDDGKRDEGKRDESRRGESRREAKRDDGSPRGEAPRESKGEGRTEPRERQPRQPQRKEPSQAEQPRQGARAEPAPDLAASIAPSVAPSVAVENRLDDAGVPDDAFDDTDAALENDTEPSGDEAAASADGATRARKRRRRRGRGRGSRARGEGDAAATVEGGPASESNDAGGGGDTPPGPPRPESPDPSGTAE
jgi:CDP-diacylglycerol--serine O-phosphatidyltransferase